MPIVARGKEMSFTIADNSGEYFNVEENCANDHDFISRIKNQLEVIFLPYFYVFVMGYRVC
ncbi:hypothetical protein LOAG_05622 [Loa loa]|uniref:Uncharacterized protein n=1 Tax=Loa loa TaxID=7209 RepID=A0A1S0U0E8_LOALO|nr:hypothetical protein LOAG_05622 [Loa loa]EFO22866.2 hypothetical protein LOAG_05622 [Loa loa]